MLSFHNDQKVKDKYLTRVKAHALADEIVKGKYWEDGKGCAVGCTIHSGKHSSYETELGIPEWLARMEDTIFEGLPNERAKSWPQEFLEAISVGKDLEQVKLPLTIFILESNFKNLDNCTYDEITFPEVKNSIDLTRKALVQMIEALKSGQGIEAARSAAESAAAWSARSAAWSARSAAVAAAEAAWSAAAAELAARSAAESAAAWSARSAAWSARSAAAAAESAAYENFADKLLELLRNAK